MGTLWAKFGSTEKEFPVDMSVDKLDERIVVHVAGEVDLANAPELDGQLASVMTEAPSQLVVDLTNVTFMDSTGLGVLVRALKRSRELDIRLDLIVTNERVLKVFGITGLDTVLPIHSSMDSITA
jgi:anti-sigma B factor antagonist